MTTQAAGTRHPVAAFYLYYVALYAPVAITISFFPLWIRAQGLDDRQTGLVMALGAALAVLVNPAVGAIADQYRSRKAILLALVGGSVLSAGLLFSAEGFVGVLLVFLATKAFSASLIPLSESMALAGVPRYGLDFGRLRSAGSMSVVAVSVALGWLVDRAGTEVIAIAFLVTYLGQGILALMLPNDDIAVRHTVKGPLLQVLQVPGFSLFLASAAVSQACHGFFYSYSALYWKSVGFSASTIGYLWALGVLAEITAFTCGSLLAARISPPALIALACAAGVLRWSLTGLAQTPGVAMLAQLLQGATLGFTQLGAAQYVRTRVPAQVLSSGTGLYAACTGLLTAACVFAGSFLFASVGGRAFLLTAAMCAVGLAAALVLRAREARLMDVAGAG
ncbi:MFS transporter [Cupriavidus sp. WS]|uniref:MFS transporter n=1 Tax=Cupriavidus sp. WS TaxID=1312922 RepID=UPI00037D27D0|nr:MFS transporter [Cupriavidus sp. WS]